MAPKGNRFKIPAIPKGEEARYGLNLYEPYLAWGGMLPVTGKKGEVDGLLVRPLDPLLIQKGGIQAFIVYNKLLFDETVQSALTKMSQEITGREWKIEPVSDKPGDVAVQEFVENALHGLSIDEVYRGMLESYIVGFTVSEVMWRRTAEGVLPYDFRFRDQRRFRFEEMLEGDFGFTLRMATREEPMEGVPLPVRKFVIQRYWAHNNGDPYGAGLARILYPLVKFKRRALESQLLYSDRFANPTAVAKAPLSATACEVDTLYDHLSNLSQETALVLPEGFELDFVNPGGSPETFETLRQSISAEINTLIAGEDEAGQADSGSRASSEVAQTVRRARAKDLSELISQTLNTTLIRWIVDLNFGTDVDSPKIYRDFEPKEDVQLSMSDVAILVKDIGLKPTVQWVTNRFDVELEEEEGQNMIRSGPEGTSGVDTEPRPLKQAIGKAMVKSKIAGAQDSSIPAEPEQVQEQVTYDAGDVNSLIDEILGENPDEDETVTTKPERGVAEAAPEPTSPTDLKKKLGVLKRQMRRAKRKQESQQKKIDKFEDNK